MTTRHLHHPLRTAVWITLLIAACPCLLNAQNAGAPDAHLPSSADLAEGRRLLEQVRDGSFAFDDPAFYWFCRQVAAAPADNLDITNMTPIDWRFLLERPGDYRGQPVILEGVLQRRTSFSVRNRPGLDILHQCELSLPGSRAIATVVVTEDPAAVSHLGRVRAQGYFIKNRAFQTTGGEIGHGPLIVARRLQSVPDVVTDTAHQFPGSASAGWIIPLTAGLAILWLGMRRRIRREAGAAHPSLQAEKASAPTNSDFDWLQEMENRK